MAATRVSAALRPPARPRAKRLAVVAGVVAIGVGVGAAAFHEARQRTTWREERVHAGAHRQHPAHGGAGEPALRGEVSGLSRGARRIADGDPLIRAQLARAREQQAPVELGKIEKRLQSASTALGEQQRAAALDFAAITRKNRAAVALVYVEGEDGEVRTGTAFAVRADATLLTNRHVVAGADGAQTPRRIAVQFSHSSQKWPARLLAVAGDADLALLRVDNIAGDVPIVQPFNLRADTLPAGAPVALIGFPLGGEGRAGGRARAAAGVGRDGRGHRRPPDRCRRGYGASGASGSPIFDAEGRVIAILFAGRGAATGQALFAVPAAAAARLMETVSAGAGQLSLSCCRASRASVICGNSLTIRRYNSTAFSGCPASA